MARVAAFASRLAASAATAEAVTFAFAGPEGRHDVSLVRPENAPSFDIFGHNRKRRSRHENAGCYFDFGTAHDFRGGLYGPASDRGSAGRASYELNGVRSASEVILGGTTDAFDGPISQAYKRAGRYRGISDRIAGFRRGDFPPRPGSNGRSIAAAPLAALVRYTAGYPPWLHTYGGYAQSRQGCLFAGPCHARPLTCRHRLAQPLVVVSPKSTTAGIARRFVLSGALRSPSP